MKPIAVFYHCLFSKGEPPQTCPHALGIITEQMSQLKGSGLLDEAKYVFIGVNGGDESAAVAGTVLPFASPNVEVGFHGRSAGSETPTMVRMWEWAEAHQDYNILYFHAKGSTHTDPDYLAFSARWSRCMMTNLVDQWQRCISDLDTGLVDSVGCHWMTNMSPPSDKDSIWGGNFFWVTGEFLRTLPDIMDRDLIKTHGAAAPISRYEGERWIGSGPKLPRIRDYHVNGIGSCP